MKHLCRSLLMVSGIALFASMGSIAEAATCPVAPASGAGYIQATTDGGDTAACLLHDPLTSDDANALNGGAGDVIIALGYTILDKTDWTLAEELAHPTTANALIVNTTTKTWTIVAALVAGFENFVLGIKDGNNEPDWAAFTLGANFLSGTWKIWDGTKDKDLSHMNLYGTPCPTTGCPRDVPPVGEIPLPAALPLLLAGLGGLGWLARCRRRNVTTA
jgi:hypothetical protein